MTQWQWFRWVGGSAPCRAREFQVLAKRYARACP